MATVEATAATLCAIMAAGMRPAAIPSYFRRAACAAARRAIGTRYGEQET